jgi:hypothetical protein
MDALQQLRNILAHLHREVGFIHEPHLILDADFDRSRFKEQASEIPGIKTELVDQRGPGIAGDDFSGHLAYQLSTGEWFVVAYAD